MLAPRFILLYSSLFVPIVESGKLRGQFHEGFEGSNPHNKLVSGRIDTRLDGSNPHNKLARGSIDIRCIDDPTSVECQMNEPVPTSTQNIVMNALTRLEDYSSGLLLHRKKDYLEEYPYPYPYGDDEDTHTNTEPMVSSAPTRDMCYGNMERLAYKKYCHSEMPSVSLEPSLAPSLFPAESVPTLPDMSSPSPSPATTPTTPVPSISRISDSDDSNRIPSAVLGMCQGDCDSPSDCDQGLYCHQRINSEQTPGCPGTELDASRTDYCTNVTITSVHPVYPGTDDGGRMKLYWNESYWWQESNVEIQWCVACPSSHDQSFSSSTTTSHRCHAGEELFLQYCSSLGSVVFFEFPPVSTGSETVQIQIIDSDLCVERQGGTTAVTVETCMDTNPQQQWDKTTYNIDDETPFELSPTTDRQLCLTIHHHPKHGETLELFPCNVSRRDTSSLWTLFRH